MAQFSLSDVQAKAILEMRLQRLTGLERDKLQAEFDELMREIAGYKEILASEERKREVIKAELIDIRTRYGDERRTDINALGDGTISDLSLIADEDMVITISHEGYIKRDTNHRIPVAEPGWGRVEGGGDQRRGLYGAPLYSHHAQYPAGIYPERPFVLVTGL